MGWILLYDKTPPKGGEPFGSPVPMESLHKWDTCSQTLPRPRSSHGYIGHLDTFPSLAETGRGTALHMADIAVPLAAPVYRFGTYRKTYASLPLDNLRPGTK